MALTVFHYPKCSTCRKAIQWLEKKKIAFDKIDIVQAPPTKAQLAAAQKAAGVPVKKMFNTSGESYRNGGYKEKLDTMSEDQAFAALAKDGKLIKRPLVVGDRIALVGFNEMEWAKTLK